MDAHRGRTAVPHRSSALTSPKRTTPAKNAASPLSWTPPAHTTISQACPFHPRTSAFCLSCPPYPSVCVTHAGTPPRHISNHIEHLRPIPPTTLLPHVFTRAGILTTPHRPITYTVRGTHHNHAALPRKQPHLTVTILADAPSPPLTMITPVTFFARLPTWAYPTISPACPLTNDRLAFVLLADAHEARSRGALLRATRPFLNPLHLCGSFP